MFRSCYVHQTGEETRVPRGLALRDRCPGRCFRDLDGAAGTGMVPGLPATGSDQANRAISTGQLNALLRLHLRPIDVVVFHGSDGDTLFRGGLHA